MSRPHSATNVCVLAGTVHRAPEVRTLRSGEQVAHLEVRVAPPDGPAEVVPVAVADPSAAVRELAPGTPVVLQGRVRRRFFRTGGATQSRTEVAATAVVPARRRAQARRLLDAAAANLAAS